MRKLLLVLLSLIVSFPADSQGITPVKLHEFGRWHPYYENRIMPFPGFTLIFKGMEPGDLYPGSTTRRLGGRFKFFASSGSSSANITWSSGTGDIGPSGFRLDGKDYILEMVTSETASGFVDENKVMVWPIAEWEKRKSEYQQQRNAAK